MGNAILTNSSLEDPKRPFETLVFLLSQIVSTGKSVKRSANVFETFSSTCLSASALRICVLSQCGPSFKMRFNFDQLSTLALVG